MKNFWLSKNKISSLLMMGLMTCTTAPSFAMNLVAFGKACLQQESQLDDLKQTIDEQDLINSLSDKRQNGVKSDLAAYHQELVRLENALQDCQNIDPNSVDCHRIRIRYNRIVVLLDRAEDRLQDNEDDGFDKRKLFYKKQHYQETYDQFLATCRNSDTHYELIQDSNAYNKVCSTVELRKTQTCTMF